MEKYTIFNFGLLHLEWTNALFVLTVFSVLVFLLHFLLFKPVLRTVLNRKKSRQLRKRNFARKKSSSEKEILQLQAEKEQTIQKTQSRKTSKSRNVSLSCFPTQANKRKIRSHS